MRDPRLRLIALVLFTVAFALARPMALPWLGGLTLLVIALFPSSFKKSLPVTLLTVFALLSLSGVALVLGGSVSVADVLWGVMRWASLAMVAATLFYSLTAFEVMAGLAALRLPSRIGIAVGVGLAFVPRFVADLRLMAYERGRRRASISEASSERGVVRELNNMVAATLVLVIRRVDSLVLSMSVQQFERRVRDHRFPPLQTADVLLALFLTTSLVIVVFLLHG